MGGESGLGWDGSYEWQTTICAEANLRLVYVDEDSGVAERTASSVAGHNALLGPVYGLLVDQLDGCQWAWLSFCQPLASHLICSSHIGRVLYHVHT